MGSLRARMADELRIIVMEGDETGQELLDQALRVLDPERDKVDDRVRALRPVAREPAQDRQRGRRRGRRARWPRSGYGLKAATVTPEGADDVGSPNRILREEIGGTVIIRTGRRIPGVTPVAGVHYPISVVRMAVGDAYGAKQWRERRGRRRDRLPHRAHLAQDLQVGRRALVPHGEEDPRARLRRAQVDGVADVRGDAQGGARRRLRAPPRGPVPAGADRRDLRRAWSAAPPTRRLSFRR